MSDPIENPESSPAPKAKRKAKSYKHLLTTAYKQDLAAKLDKLEAAGHSLVAILASSDIRGFEIITRFEE